MKRLVLHWLGFLMLLLLVAATACTSAAPAEQTAPMFQKIRVTDLHGSSLLFDALKACPG
jgi:hypothetical protein